MGGAVALVQAAVFEITGDAISVQLGNLLRSSQQAIVRRVQARGLLPCQLSTHVLPHLYLSFPYLVASLTRMAGLRCSTCLTSLSAEHPRAPISLLTFPLTCCFTDRDGWAEVQHLPDIPACLAPTHTALTPLSYLSHTPHTLLLFLQGWLG